MDRDKKLNDNENEELLPTKGVTDSVAAAVQYHASTELTLHREKRTTLPSKE